MTQCSLQESPCSAGVARQIATPFSAQKRKDRIPKAFPYPVLELRMRGQIRFRGVASRPLPDQSSYRIHFFFPAAETAASNTLCRSLFCCVAVFMSVALFSFKSKVTVETAFMILMEYLITSGLVSVS